MAERLPLEYPDSTRLLKLHHKPLSSKLHATLRNVRHSDKTKPSYTALSYTWGDTTDTKEISINGQVYLIRKNLGSFLEVLSQRQKGLWLWVDALCISQESIEEKTIKSLRSTRSLVVLTKSTLGLVKTARSGRSSPQVVAVEAPGSRRRCCRCRISLLVADMDNPRSCSGEKAESILWQSDMLRRLPITT